jgi:hypothetical protein
VWEGSTFLNLPFEAKQKLPNFQLLAIQKFADHPQHFLMREKFSLCASLVKEPPLNSNYCTVEKS